MFVAAEKGFITKYKLITLFIGKFYSVFTACSTKNIRNVDFCVKLCINRLKSFYWYQHNLKPCLHAFLNLNKLGLLFGFVHGYR